MSVTRLPFFLMALSSVLVALGSWRFLGLGFDSAFAGFEQHLDQRRLAFALHVIASPVALALGVVQFLPSIRARRPDLHRWTGRLYMLSILVGGGSGLWLALHAPGGWVTSIGFAVLAVAWLATTTKAVTDAMTNQFTAHREWMIRSFALTFSAVTLRIYLLGFALGGVDYFEASPWLAWICWVPNLIVAEWWIARTRKSAPSANLASATRS